MQPSHVTNTTNAVLLGGAVADASAATPVSRSAEHLDRQAPCGQAGTGASKSTVANVMTTQSCHDYSYDRDSAIQLDREGRRSLDGQVCMKSKSPDAALTLYTGKPSLPATSALSTTQITASHPTCARGGVACRQTKDFVFACSPRAKARHKGKAMQSDGFGNSTPWMPLSADSRPQSVATCNTTMSLSLTPYSSCRDNSHNTAVHTMSK